MVKLSPTLHLSSAACERGFSHLNIIKTKCRSRLSHARLSALMHIHLSKQTTKTFDPKQAVDLWMETANWRLNQGQGGASAESSSSTMQEAEAEDSGGDIEEDSEEECYIWGEYQTPSPGTHLSNSLKKLCAPLTINTDMSHSIALGNIFCYYNEHGCQSLFCKYILIRALLILFIDSVSENCPQQMQRLLL